MKTFIKSGYEIERFSHLGVIASILYIIAFKCSILFISKNRVSSLLQCNNDLNEIFIIISS